MRLTNLSTPINPPMARMTKARVDAKATAVEAVKPVDNVGDKAANRVMAKPRPTAASVRAAAKVVPDDSRNNWAVALPEAATIRAGWILVAAPLPVEIMPIGRTA